MQFYPLTVLSIEKLTNQSVCISFNVPNNLKPIFTYTQGQYITLKSLINGVALRRSYSICSSPLSGQLQVGIKKVEGGIFSTYANEVLTTNHVLDVAPPNGKFFTQLVNTNKKNYVGIVAGSGITPLMSLITTTLQTEPLSTFTLVYSNKNRQTIMFKAQLEALKNKYINRLNIIHILSQEKMDTPLFAGRIDNEKMNLLSQKLININTINETFLCGPETMVIMAKNFLLQQGVSAKNIHAELFGTTKPKNTLKQKTTSTITQKICELEVIKDGVAQQIKLPFDTQNILDAALNNGGDMPYACKGGVCCTCKARLTQGEVYMEVNYGLEPDEIAAGFILTCQAYPVTEKVVVNFDDV